VNPAAVPLYKNRILAALPSKEINRLARLLTPVVLKQEKMLMDGNADFGYFLEDGIASAVVELKSGDTVEVGVIGRDGVVGFPVLLDTGSMPGRTFMQIAGSGFRIDAADLKTEFENPSELRRHLQRYVQGFMVQSAQTAACNRVHTIEGRLSRWLLTCLDRVDSEQLQLTHEFLGQMLGAPRTTVTLAAGLLQRAGLIKYSRGRVTVLNRAGLEKITCECYATVRDEFRRLGLL
jgi:CRP-like cAMP-binding protein